jgi:hypothetical protein
MQSNPQWKRRDICAVCRSWPGEPCWDFSFREKERFDRTTPHKGRRFLPPIRVRKAEAAKKRIRTKSIPEWLRYEACQTCGATEGKACLFKDGVNEKKYPCTSRLVREECKVTNWSDFGTCTKCEARNGNACRNRKIEGGVRILAKPHPERPLATAAELFERVS